MRLYSLMMVAVAALVVAVVGVSGASAASMAGPGFSAATGNAHNSGTSTTWFGPGGFNITSKRVESTEGQPKFSASEPKVLEGTISIDFLEFMLGGEPCWSLGDQAGTILEGGTYKFVLLIIGGKDDLGILILVSNNLHLECKFLSLLFIMNGMVIGLIDPVKAGKAKEFLILVHAKGQKEQEVKEYLNEKEEAVKEHLTSATNEGTAEESALEDGDIALLTEKEAELIN